MSALLLFELVSVQRAIARGDPVGPGCDIGNRSLISVYTCDNGLFGSMGYGSQVFP